jgi:hypothetical protein
MTDEEKKLLTEAVSPTPKEVIDVYTEIARNDLRTSTIDNIVIEYQTPK